MFIVFQYPLAGCYKLKWPNPIHHKAQCLTLVPYILVQAAILLSPTELSSQTTPTLTLTAKQLQSSKVLSYKVHVLA